MTIRVALRFLAIFSVAVCLFACGQKGKFSTPSGDTQDASLQVRYTAPNCLTFWPEYDITLKLGTFTEKVIQFKSVSQPTAQIQTIGNDRLELSSGRESGMIVVSDDPEFRDRVDHIKVEFKHDLIMGFENDAAAGPHPHEIVITLYDVSNNELGRFRQVLTQDFLLKPDGDSQTYNDAVTVNYLLNWLSSEAKLRRGLRNQ